MANIIKPIPTATTGEPEILPWATAGVTLEPNTAQEATGWQAYGAGPPPDYRLENYARLTQSEINARAQSAVLLLEYGQAEIDINGVAPGANQRRVTILGTNIDYTDQAGDAVDADVAAAFVTLVNASVVLAPQVQAVLGAGGLWTVTILDPTATLTVGVSVLAGAGTITVTSAPDAPVIRTDPNALAYDLVIGGTQADDDGNVAHDKRIIWRRDKASIAIGEFTGTQANDANTGANSVNLGRNSKASGADSVALGPGSRAEDVATFAAGGGFALDVDAIALKGAVHVGSTSGITIGKNSESTLPNDLTLGVDAISTSGGAGSATTVGHLASSTGESSTSLGHTARVNGVGSIAAGFGASVDGDRNAGLGGALTDAASSDSSAVGTGSEIGAGGDHAFAAAEGLSQGSRSSAVGKGTIASGAGAHARGYATGAATVEATGDHSEASGGTTAGIGAADSVQAIGAWSRVHGTAQTATADYSETSGRGPVATRHGERVRASHVWTGPGAFDLEKGAHQHGDINLAAETSGAQTMVLTSQGGNAVGAGSTFLPGADTAYTIRVDAVARHRSPTPGANDNKAAHWSFWVAIQCDAAGACTISAFGAGFASVLAGGGLGNVLSPVGVLYETTGGQYKLHVVLNGAATGIDIRGEGTVALEGVRFSASLHYTKVGGVRA